MKSWDNKFISKSLYRLKERVFLSPSYRNRIRKQASDLEKGIEVLWDENVVNNQFDKKSKELTLASATIASFLTKLVKNGEEWAKQRKITHKRFSIYKHKKSQKYLVEFRFFKISENKNMKAHLIFDNFLQNNKNIIGRIVRGEFSKKGYEKLDEGVFYQKFLRNFRMQYILKGKKFKMKLRIKFINPSHTKFIMTYKPFFASQ